MSVPDFQVYRSGNFDFLDTVQFQQDEQSDIQRKIVTVTGASPTLLPWQVLHSPITSDGGQDTTMALPSAANLVSQIRKPAVGLSLTLDVYNLYASHTITITAGTGGTLLNSGANFVVPLHRVAEYIIRLDNVTAGSEAYSVLGVLLGS